MQQRNTTQTLVKQLSFVTRDATPLTDIKKEVIAPAAQAKTLTAHALPNGKLAVGYQDGNIAFWDPETKKLEKLEQKISPQECSSMCFTLDENDALYCLRKTSDSFDTIIQKWNIQKQTCEDSQLLPPAIAQISSMKVRNNILYGVSTLFLNELFIFDLQKKSKLFYGQLESKSLFTRQQYSVTALDVMKDSNQIVLGTSMGVELHTPGNPISERTYVWKQNCHNKQKITSLISLPHSRIAALLQDGATCIIDATKKTLLRTLHNEAATKQNSDNQQQIFYQADNEGNEYIGQLINNRHVIAWDIKSGKCVEQDAPSAIQHCYAMTQNQVAEINAADGSIQTRTFDLAALKQAIKDAPPPPKPHKNRACCA